MSAVQSHPRLPIVLGVTPAPAGPSRHHRLAPPPGRRPLKQPRVAALALMCISNGILDGPARGPVGGRSFRCRGAAALLAPRAGRAEGGYTGHSVSDGLAGTGPGLRCWRWRLLPSLGEG